MKKLDIYSTIQQQIESAKDIYKDNLVALFLAGSNGKDLGIEGWSDIDLYIITDKLDNDQNIEFYKQAKKSEIHVGTTFYTKDMINSKILDAKTCVSFYEYNNYKVNKILYGNIAFPEISFEEVRYGVHDLEIAFQAVLREYYEDKLNNHNNFNKLVKKTTLLMKILLLRYYKEFTIGYDQTFKKYKEVVNNNINSDIINIIESRDVNQFDQIVSMIIDDTIKEGMNNYEKTMC